MQKKQQRVRRMTAAEKMIKEREEKQRESLHQWYEEEWKARQSANPEEALALLNERWRIKTEQEIQEKVEKARKEFAINKINNDANRYVPDPSFDRVAFWRSFRAKYVDLFDDYREILHHVGKDGLADYSLFKDYENLLERVYGIVQEQMYADVLDSRYIVVRPFDQTDKERTRSSVVTREEYPVSMIMDYEAKTVSFLIPEIFFRSKKYMKIRPFYLTAKETYFRETQFWREIFGHLLDGKFKYFDRFHYPPSAHPHDWEYQGRDQNYLFSQIELEIIVDAKAPLDPDNYHLKVMIDQMTRHHVFPVDTFDYVKTLTIRQQEQQNRDALEMVEVRLRGYRKE
ncbi:CCDC34 family protein [Sulfoacidibacillus ferrooxidans]|uniref:Uncharacterized protein n=1 Tax=Sulfoacidibacillus ferrooxidans TaxID=2005001 RepID=A0A9X1VEW8_9BACL|nr:CCDC34 family protein [Sulfoacidibacillus ferrooxidans]MCI0184747.1 hypothetical protein [Sulfoacidibacillus ferrooxidans]